MRRAVRTSLYQSPSSYVRAFARGLLVIRSFSTDSQSQTISEVTNKTGLDRAAARRILRTLESLGYVEHEGAKFRLTQSVLNFASVYLSFGRVLEPVLQKLAIAVGEATSAAVLDGTEIVRVSAVTGRRVLTAHVAVGNRLPAYCTSTGRVLLGALSDAELDRTLRTSKITRHTKYSVTSISELKRIIRRDREREWSLLNQEIEDGLCALAVPILDQSQRTIAAMNVIAQAARWTPSRMVSNLLPCLRKAQQEIEKTLVTIR